jgi:carbon monoxide dehydrogenase subunit G
MTFETIQTIPAPRDKVFAMLTDPTVLQACIDGCEKMVRTSNDSYDAHLKIGAAGLKGSYVGKVQIKDKLVPESYTLALEGKGGPGWVKATARVRLADKQGATELSCQADAQVGGLIAAVGSRLIEAVGKRLMTDFFTRFADHAAKAQ